MEAQGSQLVLEKQLQQKLFLLENGVARIAHTRSQLKDNVDLVRREISACFGHQLCCLRSREQQLLSTLDTVLNVKDELLSEQQDQLHQAFGACRQGLECLSVAKEDMKKRNSIAAFEAVEVNVRDILNRLSSVEIKPRETSSVSFEADTMSLRRTLHSFGRISTCKSIRACESLPGDLEDYDDEPSLLHKPVQQNFSFGVLRQSGLHTDSNNLLMKDALTGPTSTEMETSGFMKRTGQQKDQVRHWLQQIKTQVEAEPAVFEDFEIVRQRFGSELHSTDTAAVASSKESSLDIDLFGAYFHKILSSPTDHWLCGGGLKSECYTDNMKMGSTFPFQQTIYTDPPANQKSCLADIPNWLNVFEKVKNSQNEFWLPFSENSVDWADSIGFSVQSAAPSSADIEPFCSMDDNHVGFDQGVVANFRALKFSEKYNLSEGSIFDEECNDVWLLKKKELETNSPQDFMIFSTEKVPVEPVCTYSSTIADPVLSLGTVFERVHAAAYEQWLQDYQ